MPIKPEDVRCLQPGEDFHVFANHPGLKWSGPKLPTIGEVVTSFIPYFQHEPRPNTLVSRARGQLTVLRYEEEYGWVYCVSRPMGSTAEVYVAGADLRAR